MPLQWQRLRSWQGSQQSGFEELVCQLAALEPRPDGASFLRKGAPDAGVECYWRTLEGHERGWQAKFFTGPPSSGQWSQIDGSVRQTLDRHPNMSEYTVCLPCDRQDPRISNEQWFMDKWNTHVEKWEGWADNLGRKVTFSYWGEHELFLRLTAAQHAGRLFFWFNTEYMTQDWYQSHLEQVVANAGPRYSPELHVDLPIAQLFDGLGRTRAFDTRLRKLLSEVPGRFRAVPVATANEKCAELFGQLGRAVDRLATLNPLANSAGTLDIKSMLTTSNIISKLSHECANTLEIASVDQEPTTRERYLAAHRDLYRVLWSADALSDFCSSEQARVGVQPYLVISGDAGTGKTHLLCDVARQRITEGLPTLMLLGEQFSTEDPWTQIIRMTGLRCNNADELLGALQAAAELQGRRSLILIDALNEGEGKLLWRRHLAGMLAKLKHYPNVGLAVTVRSSYVDVVIPEGLGGDQLIHATHTGFAQNEYSATKVFFDYYGLEAPTIPLLASEFSNPLFLKLFCKGLANKGLRRIPEGHQGITRIFDFFVDSVNERLYKPDQLGYDRSDRLVQNAVRRVTEAMVAAGTAWLRRSAAKQIVDQLLPRTEYERTLFRALLSEGILAEDLFETDGDEEPVEGIRFAYERLADYQIGQCLLEQYPDPTDLVAAFADPASRLGGYFANREVATRHQGLIEAWSVLLPERIGRELADLVDKHRHLRLVQTAFVQSLLWRRSDSIGEAAFKYIRGTIAKNIYTRLELQAVMLMVAAKPGHPLNADYLHTRLLTQPMPIRDQVWSTYLHKNYGEHGPVDRLLEWVWLSPASSAGDEETVRLCATAVAWFLTSSNRFLRDRATKAVTRLLEQRIMVLIRVLEDFRTVDDPYVQERLYAIAYGCAMRSGDSASLSALAQAVFQQVFAGGNPPIHILTRDYARGVIEAAVHRGAHVTVDLARVHPPYGSPWQDKIPTIEDLNDRFGESAGDIWDSVMGSGDFVRYVIGTSGRFPWSSRRLGANRPLSRKERRNQFEASLSSDQRAAYDQFLKARSLSKYSRFNRLFNSHQDPVGSEEVLDSLADQTLDEMKVKLGQDNFKVFEDEVLPFLDDAGDEFAFDLSLAQRWIFHRTMELGWTAERFGTFDLQLSWASQAGRSPHKAERLGKKYQWIAWHEFLAQVADNFEFKGDGDEGSSRPFEGVWQLSCRDIDPSFVLPSYPQEAPTPPHWSAPTAFTEWAEDPNGWVQRTDDLPSLEALLRVVDANQQSWIVLDGDYNWKPPATQIEDTGDRDQRDVWLRVTGYLVHKNDAHAVFSWASHQNLWGKRMPEPGELRGVYLGESQWSPAYADRCRPYYGFPGWTRGDDNLVPHPIHVATDHYNWEFPGYDCSIDNSVSIRLPSGPLFSTLNLRWSGAEGEYLDASGNLAAFDPSVHGDGPKLLLLRYDLYEELRAGGLDIVWSVIGAKRAASDEQQISGAFHLEGGIPAGIITFPPAR